MRRYLLRLGDKSTAGGVVLEGAENCTHHGIPITFIGARVWCEGCKSHGYIESVGPRHSATMRGKQQALEDDICICKCSPPPVFSASQVSASHSWEDEWGEMGYSASLATLQDMQHAPYDEQFALTDSTGRALSKIRYRVLSDLAVVASGVTDSEGRTVRISTETSRRLEVEIIGGR
ncbi:PAAR domain-containing protein [Paraburkholderia tropica]|uniref:PAAR domain-containing protein n=1 Tax=Paraburkholderia tropica TaxID=92647 RepID=UPI0009F39878|nr:PAAR domain-containing protein [Paraburkholderia tropica]MBB2981280.1 putative Zn-binding protein involved in type VI secretion [Paraburkholderia tropica]